MDSSSSKLYDVIVVGGGPAGASAARRCAKLGLSTLVIDKEIFPRDKLCGGGLSEQAISYLDFDLPSKIIEKEIFGARVHFDSLQVEAKTVHRVAVMVSRIDFDRLLLDKALDMGAELLEGNSVIALNINDNYIEVVARNKKYKAKLVVGADGFYSVVAKYVRRTYQKKEYGVCVEAKIESVDNVVDAFNLNVVDIHFGIVRNGYGWIFPHRGYLSVGIGGAANQLITPKINMRDFLFVTGFSPNTVTKGFPIPSGGFKRSVIANRIILVGDAAGFVDAFIGEGLAYAIRSGQLAGDAALFAVRTGNFSKQNLIQYENNCNQEFGSDLRWSLYFSRLVHIFPGIFLRLMALESKMIGKYLDVLVKKMSYQRYFLWILPRIPFFLLKHSQNNKK